MLRSLCFLYLTALAWMPVLSVFGAQGADMPFWFLAGDAYLYLGIAQASDGIAMSFDGLRATNGFHPVWQIIVRLISEAAPDSHVAMWGAALGSILLSWAGALILANAVYRFTASWLLPMLVVPGVYYLLIGQALENMPFWAFYDGMEVGLSFFLFALVAHQIGGMRRGDMPMRWWIRLGVLLALLTLTRLDEVFVPLSMALALVIRGTSPMKARIGQGLALTLPVAIGVGLFALWGLLTAGLAAPVSGAAKGEGATLANGWVTLATFFAPLIDLRAGLTGWTPERGALLGGAFRVVQLVVPTAFALGFAVFTLRRLADRPWAPLMAGIGAGVVIKGSYSILFVNYWHQAGWYYAVALGLMTLGTAILLAPAMHRLPRPAVLIATGTIAALGFLHASLWTARQMINPLPILQRDFWHAGPEIEAALTARHPGIRIIEFGDGMLNFTFTMPVRHGFVFAGDAQSLTALREGRLLRDAHADGFDVLSSYEYLHVPEGAETWSSDDIRSFLQNSFLDSRVKAELPLFDFEMLYVARPSGVPFIRLVPR